MKMNRFLIVGLLFSIIFLSGCDSGSIPSIEEREFFCHSFNGTYRFVNNFYGDSCLIDNDDGTATSYGIYYYYHEDGDYVLRLYERD